MLVYQWLVTRVISPLKMGESTKWGLANQGFAPLTKWDDPPSWGAGQRWLFMARHMGISTPKSWD